MIDMYASLLYRHKFFRCCFGCINHSGVSLIVILRRTERRDSDGHYRIKYYNYKKLRVEEVGFRVPISFTNTDSSDRVSVYRVRFRRLYNRVSFST